MLPRFFLGLLAIHSVAARRRIVAGPSKRADVGDAFGLFAYGDDIGGLPVFYQDGTFLPHLPRPPPSS